MAIISRPTKEGGAATYQGKVAAGYTLILASEVDADIDTIYSAFNGGVDTPNLVNGAVTGPKLGPGAVSTTNLATAPNGVGNTNINDGAVSEAKLDATAHLWTAATGGVLAPVTPALPINVGGAITIAATAHPVSNPQTVQLVAGARTPKIRIDAANQAPDGMYLSYNLEPGTSTNDDPTLPCWAINFDIGQFDMFRLFRGATGGGYTAKMLVDNGGNLTIYGGTAQKASGTTWTNPSDPRLKQDVAPYAAGLAEILRLRPIAYRLKADPDGPVCFGFDAAAVKEILPECVGTARMPLDPNDPEEHEVLTFDMHPVLVALVNAIQELAARLPE